MEWSGALGLLGLDCLIAGLRREDAPFAVEARLETCKGLRFEIASPS